MIDLLKVLVVGLVNPCVILIKSSDYHDNISSALSIIIQAIHKNLQVESTLIP